MLGSRRHKTGDQLAQRRKPYSQNRSFVGGERLVRGVVVRYSDRKAVERGRYKAVVAHEIDQLRQAFNRRGQERVDKSALEARHH
jgi:hypothetical protein